MQPVPFGKVVLAGLAVGVLDGLFAVGICVTAGTGCVPIRVFWGIAAAVIGRDAAVAGGAATAALGLGFHFLIAMIWASIYYVGYGLFGWMRGLTSSTRGLIVAAVVFGFLVYLVMDFVVIPLSHRAFPLGQARQTPLSSRFFWIILLGHPIFVAAPIVYLIRSREPQPAHV